MLATIHEKINLKSWFCSQKELPDTKFRVVRHKNYNNNDYTMERSTPYVNTCFKVSKRNLFLAKF